MMIHCKFHTNWEGFVLKEGNDVAIIAIGVMVHKALEAAENLRSEGLMRR